MSYVLKVVELRVHSSRHQHIVSQTFSWCFDVAGDTGSSKQWIAACCSLNTVR